MCGTVAKADPACIISSPTLTRMRESAKPLRVARVDASSCYMLADDIYTLLCLGGDRTHLFDLLRAHSKHEHVDRHFATHVASLKRKD